MDSVDVYSNTIEIPADIEESSQTGSNHSRRFIIILHVL